MASQVDIIRNLSVLLNKEINESQKIYFELFTKMAKASDMKLTPYEMDTAINHLIEILIKQK